MSIFPVTLHDSNVLLNKKLRNVYSLVPYGKVDGASHISLTNASLDLHITNLSIQFETLSVYRTNYLSFIYTLLQALLLYVQIVFGKSMQEKIPQLFLYFAEFSFFCDC